MVESQESKQHFAVGIDLGTSYSVTYVQAPSQEPRCVLVGSERTVPSEVSFGSEICVGRRAQSMANRKNPCDRVRLAKYLIGKKCSQISQEQRQAIKGMFGVEVDYNDSDDIPKFIVNHQGKVQKMRPEQISAYVLGHLIKAIKTEMNFKEATIDCVISVPARFLNSERHATKDAGNIAGINVVRVVPEPTAAILAATHLKLIREPTGSNSNKVCVIDLGGGTFDVSIAEQHPNAIVEIMGTDGDVMLGGADFTNAVGKQLAGYYCDMYSDSTVDDLWADKMSRNKLYQAAEDAKITVNLQNTDRTEVNLVLNGNEFSFDYTLNMFNKCFEPFAQKIQTIIQRLLDELKLSINSLDAILLVGGSCRIKNITEILLRMGANLNKINRQLNFDEAVAQGACVLAGIVGKYFAKSDDLLLIDCVPTNINIRTEEDISTPLIKRGLSIPCRESQVFSTSAHNQTGVTIHIAEGPYSVQSRNQKVGEFHLEGIEKAPRGVPQIEVTFDVDANGILTVSAMDKKTNVKKHITVVDDRMSTEQVAAAQKEHEQNEAEDKRIAELLRKKSQITSVIYDMEDKLEKAKDHPKFADVSALLASTKQEMFNYNTSNIGTKDIDFFNNHLNNLQSNPDLQAIIAHVGGPDHNNNMPNMPTPDMNNNNSMPNVEEAD